MERIDGPSGFLFRPDAPLPEKKEKKSGKTERKGFSGVLGQLFSSSEASAVSSESVHQISDADELKSVIDSIHQLGDELMRFPGMDNLARYRQAVRDFMSHVTGNAYATEEKLSRRSLVNQKKYTLISVINEKLDRLARNVLSSQAEQLRMLSEIEEIQGLLVNLLHVS